MEPILRDPGGDVARYEAGMAPLLEDGVHHIPGAITSWSRKEMIPVLEHIGGLLWYPCPCEGSESNGHVVYLSGAPNHHVLPTTERIARQGMRRACLVGSNYVWGWETLRLAQCDYTIHKRHHHGWDKSIRVPRRWRPATGCTCAASTARAGNSRGRAPRRTSRTSTSG